eukprot:gene11030-14811_t
MIVAQESTKLQQTNLLLIMFDDLRPELSIYGREHMLTPNFERLAKRSVVFDYAFCQVAVCNPSRDSLLTGLRPDTVGTYNFQHSYDDHVVFPTKLIESGYNTAGVGKIVHWEGNDRRIWNYDSWHDNWYDYQNFEWSLLNSSSMPDKVHPEEWFRDHKFTNKAIEILKRLLNEPKYWMLALGFKLPHITLHVPYKYYEMYKGKSASWKLSKRELKYPSTITELSYRCCGEPSFRFMREEGSKPANRSIGIGNINEPFTEEMHDELMLGYAAGVSFADKQVGRLLDVLDEYNLWNNLTVVLTADHGMHNGEKGMWEKWTLFDESTRIPLVIAHPKSPFQGHHYKEPVELIDVFPTVMDLVRPPKSNCPNDRKCLQLSGKSLAPVILGDQIYKANFPDIKEKFYSLPISVTPQVIRGNNKTTKSLLVEVKTVSNALAMPILDRTFAISQTPRCTKKSNIKTKQLSTLEIQQQKVHEKVVRQAVWGDCDMDYKGKDEIELMGYSLRTSMYRYTVYFHYFRRNRTTDFIREPYAEELYDHKNETLADFTHRETFNLAIKPVYNNVITNLRSLLVNYIRNNVIIHKH